MDELFIRIRENRYYLERAVDQDYQTLDILIQKRRNTGAAKRFFRKLLRGLRYVPLDSLPITCAAAVLPSGPSSPPSSTAPSSTPTTELRHPINRLANGNVTCVDSNL